MRDILEVIVHLVEKKIGLDRCLGVFLILKNLIRQVVPEYVLVT